MSERSVAILGAGATSPYGRVNSDHCAPVQTRHCRAPEGSGYQPEGTGVLLELTGTARIQTKGRVDVSQTRGPLRRPVPRTTSHLTRPRWIESSLKG